MTAEQRPGKVEPEAVGPDEVRPDEVGSDAAASDAVEPDDTASDTVEPDEVGPVDPAPLDWRRIVVIGAAVLAVLLVGAAVGMLINSARVTDSGPPGAGSIDVGFAQDMQVHHLQAITMAGLERDRTTDPELKTLAFDIESGQLGQAGEMAGWLTAWGQPELSTSGSYMGWMTGSGHQHTGPTDAAGGVRTMPGMASPDELTRLRSLTGRELDVYFLQLMLRHHQGALEMAQYAADHAGKGYVRNLAQKMVNAQRAEVATMTAMLAERGAQPLPAPN